MTKRVVFLDKAALENLLVGVKYDDVGVCFTLDPDKLPAEDACLVRHSVYGARDVLIRKLREAFSGD